MLNELTSKLAQDAPALRKLSDDIWNHPEIGYHETFACAQATALLRSYGFEVTTPYCNLDTAFKAQFKNGDGPVFAFCSEFDALAGLGHGCGHNLICAGGIAAFIATARYMKDHGVHGTVVLLGCPAEESYGGKVKMEEAGCLEGIDAVIMAHPGRYNSTDNGSSAVIGYEVTFHGKAAHAGGSPEKGINALDAVTLLFNAINCYRQQMPDTARLHGIITHGGDAANIIPDTATCRFYIRSTVEERLQPLADYFLDMVKGAELMTRCTAEISVFHLLYHAPKPNQVLNKAFYDNMTDLGEPVMVSNKVGRGSTDFGNFSQKIPGCHFHFAVVDSGELPGHSVEMREACSKDYGFQKMLLSSAAMAKIALDFLDNVDFRNSVISEFNGK